MFMNTSSRGNILLADYQVLIRDDATAADKSVYPCIDPGTFSQFLGAIGNLLASPYRTRPPNSVIINKYLETSFSAKSAITNNYGTGRPIWEFPEIMLALAANTDDYYANQKHLTTSAQDHLKGRLTTLAARAHRILNNYPELIRQALRAKTFINQATTRLDRADMQIRDNCLLQAAHIQRRTEYALNNAQRVLNKAEAFKRPAKRI